MYNTYLVYLGCVDCRAYIQIMYRLLTKMQSRFSFPPAISKNLLILPPRVQSYDIFLYPHCSKNIPNPLSLYSTRKNKKQEGGGGFICFEEKVSIILGNMYFYFFNQAEAVGIWRQK